MRKVIVYIYGLLDKDNQVCYVGKSTTPRVRLYAHNLQHGIKSMVILDEYVDQEQYWLDYYKSKNVSLLNKEECINQEVHKVGDIIKLKPVGRPKKL